MKIAIDISPIDKNSSSQHKVRGVGKYISLLRDNLERLDSSNTYLFTNSPQKEDVDLIHYPYFDPFFVSLPLKKKTKTVVTIHDLIPITHGEHFPPGIKGKIKWKINKRLLRKSDAIITDSYYSKIAVEKSTKISPEKIFPIHLAVDPEFRHVNISDKIRSELVKKYKLPQKFVLYVGDVTWNKNLENLCLAAIKTNSPVVMVGKALVDEEFDVNNPWNRERVKVNQIIDGNPLFVRIGFVEVDDLVLIYNIAEVMCMPSRDEGFGLPVLEGMASGCPVITTKEGSLPEVGGDAVYYSDTSVEGIANAFKEVLSSNELRTDLSKKGLEQSKKFNLQKMIGETVMVYNKVGNEKEN